MKLFTSKDKRTNLEKEIDRILEDMEVTTRSSKEYFELANRLETLYKAKSTEKSRNISPDTIAVIAGNLLGIVLILKYEELNVITSKALGFVRRV